MDRIQEFLSRYQREYDFYERAAERLAVMPMTVVDGVAG
jgi:hypothetical protein